MRYLALAEVLELHRLVVADTGGSSELRDIGLLLSAIAQPRAMFEGHELYPGLIEKATALCFSLVKNHPFVDGNKRVGHAAMETFLVLNGFELEADVEAAETAILGVASGAIGREELLAWLRDHARPIGRPDA